MEVEADLMISLEALRESTLDIEWSIENIYDCIEDDVERIMDANFDDCEHNGDEIEDMEFTLSRYQRKLKDISRSCKYC